MKKYGMTLNVGGEYYVSRSAGFKFEAKKWIEYFFFILKDQ